MGVWRVHHVLKSCAHVAELCTRCMQVRSGRAHLSGDADVCLCLNSVCPELSVMSSLISLSLSSQLPAPGVDQALTWKSQCPSHVLSWQTLHARPLPDHLRAVFLSLGHSLMTQDVRLCLATMPGNGAQPGQQLHRACGPCGSFGEALAWHSALAGRGPCLCLISRPPSTPGTPLVAQQPL